MTWTGVLESYPTHRSGNVRYVSTAYVVIARAAIIRDKFTLISLLSRSPKAKKSIKNIATNIVKK